MVWGILAVGSGCGPTVILVETDDGTTTDPPGEDDDPPPGTSTSTTTTTGTTTSTSTTSPPSTTTGIDTTTGSTTDAMPVPACLDQDLGTLTGAGIAQGSTDMEGNDFEFCGSEGSPGGDYVVRWTAPTSDEYHFQLAGSDFDTVIGVFPPDCDATLHTCNDDCLGVASSATMTLQEGDTIFIVIDGFEGEVGNFVLTIGAGVGECGVDDGGATFIVTGV
jgi:hypothetical protein